jgi:signal transduction histidine kinase
MIRRRRRLRALTWPLHELRGALTALQLGLSTQPGARTEALLLQLDRARTAVDDLDSFLEGKRCPGSAGREELVDMRALVRRAARGWSQLAPCYGAKLRSSWRAGRVKVRGRSAKLARALDNVIANAIEHGDGDVLVEAELAGDRIRIAVADEGHGALSLPYLRDSTPRSRRGHGLAITRSTVTDHGGRLLFEKREHGSAVVIELPLAEPDAASAATHPAKPLPVPAGSGAQHAA